MKQTAQPKTTDRMKPLHGLHYRKAFLSFSLANSEQRNTDFWRSTSNSSVPDILEAQTDFSQYRGEILLLTQVEIESYIVL